MGSLCSHLAWSEMLTVLGVVLAAATVWQDGLEYDGRLARQRHADLCDHRDHFEC